MKPVVICPTAVAPRALREVIGKNALKKELSLEGQEQGKAGWPLRSHAPALSEIVDSTVGEMWTK